MKCKIFGFFTRTDSVACQYTMQCTIVYFYLENRHLVRKLMLGVMHLFRKQTLMHLNDTDRIKIFIYYLVSQFFFINKVARHLEQHLSREKSKFFACE